MNKIYSNEYLMVKASNGTGLFNMISKMKSKGIKVDLIKGSNGVFDVDIDGKVVYSKHTTEQFPNQGEPLMLI